MLDERAMNTWDYKEQFVDELFAEFGGRPARVLDLGCGAGRIFIEVLKRHENVAYTGVEPDTAMLARAREVIGHYPNVNLSGSFGENFVGDEYDLVMSLSVLEHVKRLRAFLARSVQLARLGGRIVHRYDLGHALMPSTRGERLRVAVARRLPALVPAASFTTYPDRDAIVGQLRQLGVARITVTQSQIPSLKSAMNQIDRAAETTGALVERIVRLDRDLWDALEARLDAQQRDRLFPTVTISGYRATKSRPGRASDDRLSQQADPLRPGTRGGH